MLSYISMTNAAVPAAPALAVSMLADRVRPGAGTSLRRCGPVWLSDDALLAGQRTLLAGSQAKGEVAFLGSSTHATGLVDFARQQRTSKKYANSTKMYARPTTSIATTSGGARGPHPARDPV